MPSEASFRMPLKSSETPRPWVQWTVLFVGALVAYGAVVPDFYMAADDLFATRVMDDVDRQGQAGVGQKLRAVFFQAAGVGHFRPIQDVVYVLAYEIFGVDRWIRVVALLYAACHLASARLISSIMSRLGCPGWLGFAAALLFALHPVWDENLVSVQFGNNVPGLTSILAATLLWLPIEGEDRRRARMKLLGAAALVYVAIGFGINMMVSAVVLFGVMTIAIAVRRRSVRELLVRGGTLVLAIFVSAAHRQLAYGSVGTRHGSYVEVKPTWQILPFVSDLIDAVVLLEDSPTARWAADANPPNMTWGAGPKPLASLDTVVVVVAAAALVALLILAKRKSPAPAAPGPAFAPSVKLGLLFAVAMTAPYFIFVGQIGVHRYVYPAVAGLAMAATAAAGAIGRRLSPSGRSPLVAAIGAVLLFGVLAAFLRVDREAARSIAAGHRVAHGLVSQISAEVRAHPEIRQVFVIGQPCVVGRCGFSTFSPWLRAVVNARMRTRLNSQEQDFIFELGHSVDIPLPDDVALYVAAPDGVTLRRAPRGTPEEIPPYVARIAYPIFARAWRLTDPEEVVARLGSSDPRVAGSTVRLLFEVEGGERRHLIETAFERYPPTPALMSGALDAARLDLAGTGRGLAAKVALKATGSPELAAFEKPAFGLIAHGNIKFDLTKARAALASEKAAIRDAEKAGTAQQALAAFEAAESTWRQIGAPRPDLERSVMLTRLVLLDDAGLAQARADAAGKQQAELVAGLDGLAAVRQKKGLHGVEIRRSDRGLAIENRSGVSIPGGVSPISGRLRLTWLDPSGVEVAKSESWLPRHGIKSGETWTMIPIPPSASSANAARLRAELTAFGASAGVEEFPAAASGAESR